MKKMILGVLLSIIGLFISITIFASFYADEHRCIWRAHEHFYTELEDIFWLSIFIMLAGIVICVAEAFGEALTDIKKSKNISKSE